MDKIKFGIIGVGNMGKNYLDYFTGGKIQNGYCAAIADIDRTKIEYALRKYPGEYEIYSSGEEMIEKSGVDAVLVAVPHYQHPELVMKALSAGKNVVCEKPAGVYTKQVKEMNEFAKNKKSLFTMMYNQRTNPLYIKMRELVKNGDIGEIRRVNWIITNWFRTQYYFDSGSWRATWKGEGGGVLLNQCPHQLDLLQWIVGMMPDKIRAFCHFGKWHDIETEDDVTAYMEFPNGATGVFVTSTGDAPGTNRFEVLGSKGKIVCENDELKVYRSNIDIQQFLMTTEQGFTPPEYTEEIIKQGGENPQHAGILNNFVNTLLGIEELYVKGEEGIHCVELMDAMLLSSWKGETISLPIDDEEYLSELNERIKTSKDKNTVDKLIDNTMSFGGTK